jgi:hypothetical protein
MAQIEIRTSSSQSSQYSINGAMIPFNYTYYDLEKLLNHALINIYHGIAIGAVDLSPNTPNGISDLYAKIRLNAPNTEIIYTDDPYDSLGNITRFLSEVDDSIGRDGDILVNTLDYKMYKRENGIYVFKLQMQGGGSGGTAVAAQWHFSTFINNTLGVDGDLLLRSEGQVYKKINGVYVYQMTIAGVNGDDGLNGEDGTRIFLSTGANTSETARENDLNIVDNILLYRFGSGIWNLVGSMRGEKGLTGNKGDTGNSPTLHVETTVNNSVGVDGDLLFNSTDYKFYKRVSGTYVLEGQLTVPPGAKWYYSETLDIALGAEDDLQLTLTGDVYLKTPTGYVLQVNIKGPAGADGANGDDGDDGSEIYFNATVDDTIGSDGDVLIVGNEFYKKETGAYVLQNTIDIPEQAAGGMIDWGNYRNSSSITLTTSYQTVLSIVKVIAKEDTEISLSAGAITLPSGKWDLHVSIDAKTCLFDFKIEIGSTVFLEKTVTGRDYSFNRSIILQVSEPLVVKIKGDGTIDAGGLNISAYKLDDLPENTQISDVYNAMFPSLDFRGIYDQESANTTSIVNRGTGTGYSAIKPMTGAFTAQTTILGEDKFYQTLTSSQWLIITKSSGLPNFYSTSESFVISLFLYIDSVPTSGPIICFQRHHSCGESGLWIDTDRTLGLRYDRVSPCDGATFPTAESTTVIPFAEWVHIALSYNAPLKRYEVYLNGNKEIDATGPRDLSAYGPHQINISGVNNASYSSAGSLNGRYSDISIKTGVTINENFSAPVRYVPSYIDLINCPTGSADKNIHYLTATSANTTVALDSTLLNADIVYIDLDSDSQVTFNNSTLDGKRVVVYIRQRDINPRVYSVSLTNLSFPGFIEEEDLIYSNEINEIDMFGLQYDLATSKWKVLSFISKVF